MKILIADDEYLLRRITKEMLSKFGQCDTVINGTEAIDAFKTAHRQGIPYDLITMDIMMPEINGIETLKYIREWEKNNNIAPENKVKIVMITGSKDKMDFLHSFSQGCEAYIIKPFSHENLMDALSDLGFINKT